MIAQFTTPCDSSPQKKPADAWPALIALSMRRTLRKLYDGPLFRFRQQGQEYDYPRNIPDENEDAFVVKIYDQKAYFGYGLFNAEQSSEPLQPRLLKDDNGYYAYFKLGQYMDLTGDPASNIGKDFTITAIGDGSHPRPMIGIFGVNQVSVEPGRKTNRFTFNDDFGSISKDSGNLVNQLFSGIDSSQNNERVITMKSDGAGEGQKLINNDDANFDTVSIGRLRDSFLRDRFFEGSFIEVTIHLGGLTKVAADQLWEEAKSVY